MSIRDMLEQSQKEDTEKFERFTSKLGPYTGEDCPNCCRVRIMKGKDGKRRCEKCAWCIEDNQYDADLI